jgi:hypothetical protein
LDKQRQCSWHRDFVTSVLLLPPCCCCLQDVWWGKYSPNYDMDDRCVCVLGLYALFVTALQPMQLQIQSVCCVDNGTAGWHVRVSSLF